METFLKGYLPIFFVGFIFLVFIVPSVRVYKQTGINPFRFITENDKTHDFVGATMKVFILILFVAIGLFALSDKAYEYLAPFRYLESNLMRWVGLVAGHLALIGIIIAQLQMRQSWRIGIDYENKTQLITTGLFSFSRNPIYLFLIISLVGVFVIIPNALTFSVLFAAFLILQVTMRLEEDFLLQQHGEQYLNYMKKVKRLI